jgi:hypothetical protein
MSRPKKARPNYRFHSSGQAVITLDAREFYLGTYDSPKSHARYLELVTIYNANGLKMPDDVETHLKNAPITVRCLTLEFRQHAQKKFVSNPHRLRHFERLCETIDDAYGDTPVDEFGPRRLAEIRGLLVADRNTRSYGNQQTREIV